MARETAVERVHFDVGQVAAVCELTLKDDKTLAENTQLEDSSTCRPGQYIQSEMIVSDFDRWYLECVAPCQKVNRESKRSSGLNLLTMLARDGAEGFDAAPLE